VSVGSLSAAAVSQFKIGEEVAASKFLIDTWMSASFGTILRHWVPGSVVQGFLFKSGLFDSSPLRSFISANVNLTGVRNSGRHLKVGATNLNTGKFEIFNETTSDLISGILASCSIPGVFPIVDMKKPNGEVHSYVDGGVHYMTPIKNALKKCEELGATEMYVDVILAIGDVNYPGFLENLLMTPFVLLKTMFGLVNNIFIKDIENARHAFPHAKIRVIKPSKWLPGWFLGFGHTKEMIELGYLEAAKAIRENPW
jgi:predicted acylesterase/phospholipase RssA